MKNFINTALLSLALFAMTNNTYASELINKQELHQAIVAQLEEQRQSTMQERITTEQVAQILSKAMLQQHTDQLIATARQQLPANRFRIVIAE